VGEQRAFVTVDDYEPVAREVLAPDIFGFLAGGAGDEWTMAENRRAFERWYLRPRMLRGSNRIDTSTVLFGQRLSTPIVVAPWAFQSLVHPDGELATARAAGEAGSLMVVSSSAMDQLEEIATAGGGPKWWQLYVFTDREATAEMLKRVVAAGYGALCLTVDFQAVGLRHRDTRSGFVLPMGPASADVSFDDELSWEDIPWIKEQAPGLPLLLKGILTAEDAHRAVESNVEGIVVSNHGGRQLDGAPATLTVLPEIVEAVDGRVPVLVDGGVRRGTDVVKAIALGAAAVLVGRPAAWGLAAAGEKGVAGVLRILAAELENAMALCGCLSVPEITRALVAPST
jgi:isopentenyl diphosphate isomerase/L-lactate dehydrogenase-like FMN-dependent dehydrogenase